MSTATAFYTVAQHAFGYRVFYHYSLPKISFTEIPSASSRYYIKQIQTLPHKSKAPDLGWGQNPKLG